MYKLVAVVIILFTTQAMALNIQGQSVGVRIEGDTEAKRVVKSASAPTVIPTSDCLGGASIGAQAKDWGLSFGGTRKSKPCNNREDAKIQLMMGNNYLAYLIHACKDKETRELTKYTNMPCPNLKKKTPKIPRPTYR